MTTDTAAIQEALAEKGFKLSPEGPLMSKTIGDADYCVDLKTHEILVLDLGQWVLAPENRYTKSIRKILADANHPAPENNPSDKKSESGEQGIEENEVEAEIVSDLPAMPTRSVATPTEYTDEQIQTISNTVAKGADQNELAMFLHLCTTYGLDPFLKEIFYSSQMKTIMTSRDGYLKIAQRDPAFGGMQSMAVCANDEFELDVINHTVKHKFGQGNRGDVIGAWAIVYRKGRNPVIAYADYAEYNKNNAIWKTYKSAMICKVAESFALKRQFGISGLVTREEIQEVA
jgi:phage recombination protein Bet